MALSYNTFIGNGTTGPFNITFPYLEEDDIEVYVDGVAVSFTFQSASQILLDVAAPVSSVGLVRRFTDIAAPEVVFQDASTSKAADFNLSDAQLLYLIQETQDNSPIKLADDGQADAQGLRIEDLGTPVDGSDAVTKDYVDALALGGPPGTIDGGIIQAGTIPADRMVANSITATQLAPESVGTSELAVDAVDTAAIQNSAVTTAKILDGNVTTDKILDGNVTTDKILDGNVTGAKLASNVADNSTLEYSGSSIRMKDGGTTFAKLAAAAIASQVQAEAGTATDVLMTPQRTAQAIAETVEYGTYTPTLFNGANVASSTAFLCRWYRVGDIVTVSGRVNIDPGAAAATVTVLDMSLPIASNFASDSQLTGTSGCPNIAQAGSVYANVTDDRASLSFPAANNSNAAHTFIYSYRVLT